jgi:hypothetical protein
MPGRFDYVKYDEKAAEAQALLKSAFLLVEKDIDTLLSPGRAQALALTALEEAYMWVGKAIRDDQIARGSDSADQPRRGE